MNRAKWFVTLIKNANWLWHAYIINQVLFLGTCSIGCWLSLTCTDTFFKKLKIFILHSDFRGIQITPWFWAISVYFQTACLYVPLSPREKEDTTRKHERLKIVTARKHTHAHTRAHTQFICATDITYQQGCLSKETFSNFVRDINGPHLEVPHLHVETSVTTSSQFAWATIHPCTAVLGTTAWAAVTYTTAHQKDASMKGNWCELGLA